MDWLEIKCKSNKNEAMQKLRLVLITCTLVGCASQSQYDYQPRFNNYLNLPAISTNHRDVMDKSGFAQLSLVQPLRPNYRYDVISNSDLERRIRFAMPGNKRDVDCSELNTTLLKLNQQLELMQRDANGAIDFGHPEKMTDSDFQRNHRLRLLAWKLRYACAK